jgi:Domain of unknown function (DUF4333)
MTNMIKRGLASTGTAGVLLLGTVGCGAGTVDRAEVATKVSDALTGQGVQVENMTCPADLQATVGQILRCEFTAGGQPVDAVVAVTAVEDGVARYDVHTEARPVASTLLAQKVAEMISQDAGVTIDGSACAGDLQPQAGQSVTCDLTAGEETATFAVTVTSINGGLVNFDVEQV